MGELSVDEDGGRADVKIGCAGAAAAAAAEVEVVVAVAEEIGAACSGRVTF